MLDISQYEKIEFGYSVAEAEDKKLQDYFLETSYWRNLKNGQTDILIGQKGTGKSALYLQLSNHKLLLSDKGITLLEAENPRGEVVFEAFRQHFSKAPLEEKLLLNDIQKFWKVYFLTLIVNQFQSENIKEDTIKEIIKLFEALKLIPAQKNLKRILEKVLDYLGQVLLLKIFQPKLSFNPMNPSLPEIGIDIVFQEPKLETKIWELDEILEIIDAYLHKNNRTIWVSIDRLDVAFQDDLLLEKRALKSLLIVCNHFAKYENISLKVFLREDLWKKILNEGLREASHLIRVEYIKWDESRLFNVVMRRILINYEIWGLSLAQKEAIEKNKLQQEKLFYQLFPLQIEQKDTFVWILSMLTDSNHLCTPRELIHYLNQLNILQIELIDLGESGENTMIYSEKALKKALEDVAIAKFRQSLIAENPELTQYIALFDDLSKSVLTIDDFKEMLKEDISKESAIYIAKKLAEIGFWKQIGKSFHIPNLYQIALGIKKY